VFIILTPPQRHLSTGFLLGQAAVAAAVEHDAAAVRLAHRCHIRQLHRDGRQVDDRAAGAADEVPVGGGVAVVAILAVHTADDLHRALRPEPRQIAVDGGQREVGYAGLQLAVHPLRRWVAGGGTQALQYGFPLGAVPCGVHGLRSFLVANNYRFH